MAMFVSASQHRLAPVGVFAFLLWTFGLAAPIPAPAAQIGDYGSFTMVMHNDAGSAASVRGQRLSVLRGPAWFGVDPNLSSLGPVDIPPGQSYTFNIVYQLLDGYLPTSQVEIEFQVTHIDSETIPSTTSISIMSTDGLKTFWTECRDDFGACRGVLADDVTPPVSELHIYRPKFISTTGVVYWR